MPLSNTNLPHFKVIPDPVIWGADLLKFDDKIGDKQKLLSITKNYIRVLTGRDIHVSYSVDGRDESYTDGKVITISSSIEPTNIAKTIGVGLHEASHCAITDFDVIKDLMAKRNLKSCYHRFTNYIKGLHNWVEDRRIDSWAIDQGRGYKKFYEALYDHYFYNSDIELAFKTKTKELSEETGRNYEFCIIHFAHPENKMSLLKGLPKIKEILDIENIDRWETTEDTLKTSLEIFDVIFDNLSEEERNKISNDKFFGGGKFSPEDLANLDGLLKKLLEMAEAYLDGDSQKVTMPQELADLLDSLTTKGVDLESVGNSEVVTISHVDIDIIKSGTYSIFKPVADHNLKDIVSKGLSLGKVLGNKLKVRTEIKTLKTIKQLSGKLDKRNLHSAGFGSNKLFYNIKVDKFNDIAIHISLDLSGSMGGAKWNNTLLATVAIAKASSSIQGIRVQISLRYTSGPIYAINFYDSKYDSVKKLELMSYVSPAGSTPEGLCFEALSRKIMKPLINKDTLFINFSDGAPDSNEAIKITKKTIKRFKEEEMNVLSYFISNESLSSGFRSVYSGSDRGTFIDMYGKDAEFIDVNSLSDLAKTINKKLLNMGK